jgi:hypothetical protein
MSMCPIFYFYTGLSSPESFGLLQWGFPGSTSTSCFHGFALHEPLKIAM